MLRILSCLCFLFTAPIFAPLPSLAQAIERDYDPARLPYAPKRTAVDGCGISLGVDPTWTREHEKTQTEHGNTREKTKFSTSIDGQGGLYWNKFGVPMDRIAYNHRLDLFIFCITFSAPATAESYLDALYSRRKDQNTEVAAKRSVKVRGLNRPEIAVFRDRSGATLIELYAKSGQATSLQMIIRFSGTSSMRSKGSLKAGEVYEGKDPGTREVLRAQMKYPTLLGRSRDRTEQIYRGRSFEEDWALAMRIVQSIR